MNLIAEILDDLVIDKNDEKSGRVDGIVLELEEGHAPRVAYLVISPITFIARLNRRVAWWYARHDRRFGPERGVPFRIPWSRVQRDGASLRVDFDAEKTPIDALEDWLRTRIVEHIPGSGECR